ncbi:class I adenylate-forming enzyme family protein [Halalkalicoccus sp. NIPERK01]|uniref:class I adenylate-forming enzyme family protein n=1 Tax=Halalkalicoccus sp. NIPERK01 TaxID=3053469 RepID=UPI00256EEC37|nr:class I adenylate-forming enzyme family protein [Halalkalicoccus sp. NIPERK01]MDL5361121.1 class I adenylate-forming enzyme family protein [Halalkalicoccus sp. NIPERK01]
MRDPVSYQRHAAPDSAALLDAETGEEWTYDDLDRAVERRAGRLWSLGLRPGDQLGVLADTAPEFARLVHAAWRIGAVFAPLNTRLPEAELRAQVERLSLAALVTDEPYTDRARAVADAPVISFPALAEAAPAEFVAEDPPLGSPRTMLFTSGTTGEPKAVVLTGRNLLASAVASAFRLGVLPDDRWYDPLSGYHMGGLAPIVRSALYGTCVVLPGEFDAEDARSHLHEHGITGVSLVPTMLSRLLDMGEFPDSLRFVLTGGAPTTPELIARCERRGVPIHPTYGMTETASQVATARPTEAFANPKRAGRPLAFTRVRALDGNEPLPTSEPGELVVSGPAVMTGYYDDPEANERVFGPHGFRTGDLGVVEEDGSIRVLGRVDDAVITGGENVHPAEVARVLRSHPRVAECAVVGLPDPEWGERVCALVVGEASEGEIRGFLEGRLAGYKRPKTIAFSDSLPRTASGTVDRGAVRETLSARSERLE